jgi:hypothetical protein
MFPSVSIYIPRSGYCCKMAAAITKSSVGKKVNYIPLVYV